MKKINHASVYKIAKSGIFDHVNSYDDLNKSIKFYGELVQDDYTTRTGEAFEIYTEFFSIRNGKDKMLSILNIQDTSSDPFNAGYDFNFIDILGRPGMVQSKWRSNPMHQFTLNELSTNGQIAYDMDILKDNNILFINIDDTDNLFKYTYPTARNKRRVIGRNAQEEFILRDPEFWNEFRKCIEESAKSEFEDPFKPRDIQEWILNGIEKDAVVYEGTVSVLNGTYTKGRVQATTAAGKTLCQFFNITDAFNVYDKNVAVAVMPTRSLISQTFGSFYKWKMFGYEENNQKIDSNVSALIIMSGDKPKYNNQIANVLQTLNKYEAVNFIESEVKKGRKVVVFVTMMSQKLKYQDIVDKLKEKNIRIGLELIDEYHNIISSSVDRAIQLDIVNYLENNYDRTDGTIFYSASNKNGQILSSFNEDLFGKLLCKVNRNELRARGFVCPSLTFKVIRVKSSANNAEVKRNAKRNGVDLDKAQSETVGIITAFNDAKKYYENPNLITFGDHVEGCRFISKNNEIKKHLPGVTNYFMAAETSNSERVTILDNIRNSGNNILHQHSVAKEGVNLQNLNGGILGRGMNIIGTQQGIGRSDRALPEDTINFQKGLLSLDNPIGWKKYRNLVYLIVDDDDDSVKNRVTDIVRFLLDSGIPEDQWDITVIDDETKNKVDLVKPNFETTISSEFDFNSDKIKKMIDNAKIEIIEEEKFIVDELERIKECERIQSLSALELLDELGLLN